MSLRGALVIFVVACAGCYDPPTGACGITCDTTCPGDLVCSPEHLCVPADGTACAPPAIGFASISLGGRHSCGIDTDGALFCWGDNREGQLGVGSPQPTASRPTQVAGKWLAVAAGGAHTCAIRDDGVILCWGDNGDGQARGSQGGSFDTPTELQFGIAQHPVFDHIAAGGRDTCALGAGQLWCWGSVDSYSASPVATSVATRIGALDDWTNLALGADFGCATSASAGVECWGLNDDAIVEFPATQDSRDPTPRTGLPAGTVQALAGGANTMCAIVGGGLSCWGDGGAINGMLGQPQPVMQVGTETGWTAVAIGEQSLCGLIRGHAFCWGHSAGTGVLGHGLWDDALDPAEAADLGVADHVIQNVRPFDGNQEHTACLLADAKLSCWGENSYGQLGLGEVSWYPTPIEVAPPSGTTWTHVISGEQHSCATTADLTLRCWGNNELGDVIPSSPRGRDQPCIAGQPCDYARPELAPISPADDVIAGDNYTCARSGSTISCWGNNSAGMLGATTGLHGPTTLNASQSAFDHLMGGNEASCGHLADDDLACWGNVAGVGHATPNVSGAVQLVGIHDIQFGDNWGCGVNTDGHRVCFGSNDAGQLGTGDTTPLPTPTVMLTPMLTKIAARGLHACGITDTGGVSCWGGNDRGQSGATGGNTTLTPTTVLDATMPLAGCSSIAVSYRHSCAVCAGKPVCWGENGFAQLGRGVDSFLDSRRAGPVLVPATLNFIEVSTFESGGCALSTEGRLFCWGDSTHGAVGAGGTGHNLPVPVASGG